MIQQLADQRAALAASSAGYDSGHKWEAARLATTVFTLLHDGGSIRSVLSQLGVRGALRFTVDGPEFDPKNLVPYTPLIALHFQPAMAPWPVPKLNENPGEVRILQFPAWWADDLIYHDGQFSLTRRRLVFGLRHQDGGSHVGELTDEGYVRFKTKAIWHAQVGNNPPEPVYGSLAATMRQVAWEVNKALDELGAIG